MVPAAAVAAGTAAAWLGGVVPRAIAHGTGWMRAIQIAGGTALLGAGVISLARRTGGLADVGSSTGAIAVVVGGLAMFAAPALGRLLRSLDEERAMRIREDERAAVAAHLHDSVLQSLVLIQRTDDPRHMVSLARRQERELRAWLYNGRDGGRQAGDPATLHAALDALTIEIESDHDVRVEAVVVGDQPLDGASRTLVAAIREALVNAARHADVDRVDVFVEADGTELTGFVRDTGRGFDRARVPDDRRGISDSIVGRVERAGGSAVLTSTPGGGTEVELRVPRRVRP
jgi:signal transduction histidine kinase